jgi:hypothetical protein
MTNQNSSDLGARINAAARLAVALHQGMDVCELTTVGQRVRIGDGRPGWFTDEQMLPLADEARRTEPRARIAERGRAGR